MSRGAIHLIAAICLNAMGLFGPTALGYHIFEHKEENSKICTDHDALENGLAACQQAIGRNDGIRIMMIDWISSKKSNGRCNYTAKIGCFGNGGQGIDRNLEEQKACFGSNQMYFQPNLREARLIAEHANLLQREIARETETIEKLKNDLQNEIQKELNLIIKQQELQKKLSEI